MFITTESGDLTFEAAIRGKEEFGGAHGELYAKAYIMAESAQDIVLDINCFNVAKVAYPPELLLELYVDGILRNIIKPHTGRGLADGQFAEAKLDRGVIMTTEGWVIMKKFHFVDLDLDDGKSLRSFF
jgi:hypothetical protein